MVRNQKKVLGARGWGLGLLLVTCHLSLVTAFGQTPGPIFAVNAKGVQGVGPGNWPRGSDVDIYVSPSGSDTTGNGTSGNPYLTIGRALQDVPAFVSHHYIIHLAAGTYREQVNLGGRFFGTNVTVNFKQASIELRGDVAAPDNYVISGANVGAPTVPVRDYAVVCSFGNCILNGVSLQYAAKSGFLQQGGVSVLYQSTFRHFTASSASKAVSVRLGAICELRGDSTVSDAYNGVEVTNYAQIFGYYAGYDYLETGFPVNTTFTLTGITSGFGIGVFDKGFYSVSGTTSVSGTGAANSKGVFVGTYGHYDSEWTTISSFNTGVLGEVHSQVEINAPTLTNLSTGVKLKSQSHADWFTSDPSFTNVTTHYILSEGSWVSSPTTYMSDGTIKSTGAINLSAGGTNQNITLTPSGTGKSVLNGQVGIGTSSPYAYFNLTIRGQDYVEMGLFPQVDAGKYAWTDYVLGISNPNATPPDKLLFAVGAEATYSDAGSISGQGFYIADLVAGPSRFKIDANGKVQIVKSFYAGLNTVSFSSTPTFDANLGNTQKITLTDNVTSSTLSNATAGQQIDFIICQDGTGGRTFVWPTNVKGGMTIGATLSTCSAQSFIFDGTTAYALSPGVANM